MTNAAYAFSKKRFDALDVVDRMPGQLRACVHEYGLPVVSVLMKHGVKDPRHIREVAKEFWLGARQTGQKTGAMGSLDVILSQGPVSSAMLNRFLADNNLVIVSVNPSRAMIDASMEAVSGFNVRVTKEEKHVRRLRAALYAAMKEPLA